MKKQIALVGIVPRENLWLIIQKEKWYHIPVKSAPRDINKIEYIAFYFPKVFSAEYRNKIIYYAKVLSIDIVKRSQLFPKELAHERAQEDYYQLHLDKIDKLPRTISSERMIIHVVTNLEKLFTANDLNDLYDGSPIEEAMYQRMKQEKIKVERQMYIKIDDKRYFLDFEISCKKGKIDIECDGEKYHSGAEASKKDRSRNNELASVGWQVLRFSGKEIFNDIDRCINVVKRTISSLGGVES